MQSTRQLLRDGSQYFGPYSSVGMQRSVLEFIREVVPLRTCKLNLAPEAIARGRYSVCLLQYHLGNCKGPCVGAQSEESMRAVGRVGGGVGVAGRPASGARLPSKRRWHARAAAELRFEAAQRCKQRLDALDNYSGKSVIVSAKIGDVDVFSLLAEDDEVYCNFVRIRHGSIVGVYTVKLSPGVETDRAEMLTLAIQHIVERVAGGSPRARGRGALSALGGGAVRRYDLHRAQAGREARPALLSERSARIYRAEQLRNLEIRNPERHTERLMESMRRELRLDRQPRHIECFDNSNLQGTNPVASCVVFRDGKPLAQGVSPLQCQDGGGGRRLRVDARNRGAPLPPSARRRGRTARPDRGRWRQGAAVERLCRVV